MHVIDFGVNGWIARFDEGADKSHMASLGAALGQVWSRRGGDAVVYVGFDGRRHSLEHAQVIASALAGYGLDVGLSREACPAPSLGLAVARNSRAVGGVMITGSDAPNVYEGLIAHGPDGGSVSAGFAQAVDQAGSSADPSIQGTYQTVDLLSPYLEELQKWMNLSPGHRRLRVVVDGLHGVGGAPVAGVLKERGFDVELIHEKLRPDFAGMKPQACEPWVDDCEEAVRSLGADMGIVLDGDGMRSAVIDERGDLVAPQHMVPLLLHYLVEERGMRGRVVRTLPCSAGVRTEAERQNLEVTTVPVGFERLHDEILEGDVLLACDEFGGVSLPAHLAERDGALAALLLAEMLANDTGKRPLSRQVLAHERSVGRQHYVMCEMSLETAKLMGFANALPGLNPKNIDRRQIVDVSHADGLKLVFDDHSWLMVRPSRRRPIVRVYAEAFSLERRDQLLGEAVAFVRGGYKTESGE